MLSVAHVFGFFIRYVEVYPEEDIFKTLGCVVHEAELKPLLVEKGFGKGSS